jgi:hypothetical protein
MTVNRTITYEGPAPYASALVQILKEHRVEVDWDSPEERRGIGPLEIVSLALGVIGALPEIEKAVAKFRERFPRVKAEIDQDEADADEDDGDGGE